MTPSPPRSGPFDPTRLLAPLTGLLVCVVLAGILRTYPRYVPPDFTTDFLLGRQDAFHGVYPWAFYAHIAAGPVTLLLGLVLMSGTLRRHLPAWHRLLGRAQVAIVLLVLAPSGLWMSASAATARPPVSASGRSPWRPRPVPCSAGGRRSAAGSRLTARG